MRQMLRESNGTGLFKAGTFYVTVKALQSRPALILDQRSVVQQLQASGDPGAGYRLTVL